MLLSNFCSLPTVFSWFCLTIQKSQGPGAWQTSVPVYNLIDLLESVKTSHIFLNGSLSMPPFNFSRLLPVHTHSKGLSYYILVFSHLQLKLWFTLVIPDHLELCKKPVLAAKHPSVQLGFILHGTAKFTHNSGNRISSSFPPES